MYGAKNGKGFRVFFLADDRIRTFPEKGDRVKPENINGDKIKPENINGGYTYSCNTQSIVLYRAEDATRVLIHELMHSSCADNHKNSVDIIESETEAWAELIYIALISEGKPYIFNALLRRQSEWMRKQNKKIKKYFMKDPSSQEFPWRYTIGKEDVWKRWGILFESEENPKVKIGNSLRLTYPPDSNLKKRFNVLEKSTIL
jgi:hypothetical protein